jgi:transcriptional regulator with XRE-family HTH domain
MARPDSPESLIPRRVREERQRCGWTLEQLAERAGVSRAMISKIERGESSPTAALLSRLGAAMGVSLSSLMSAPRAPVPALRRMDDQPVWADPETGYVRRLVSPTGGEGDVEIVAIELPPGRTVTFAPSGSLRSDEQVLLLEGALTLDSGGVSFDLRTGDCARLDAGHEHAFRNGGAVMARYLVVKRLEPAPSG